VPSSGRLELDVRGWPWSCLAVHAARRVPAGCGARTRPLWESCFCGANHNGHRGRTRRGPAIGRALPSDPAECASGTRVLVPVSRTPAPLPGPCLPRRLQTDVPGPALFATARRGFFFFFLLSADDFQSSFQGENTSGERPRRGTGGWIWPAVVRGAQGPPRRLFPDIN
jgi:hypothetical protein